MFACWKCGKVIKGKMVAVDPPNYVIQLGVDFPKKYHPKCYERQEKEAAEELRRGEVAT
jgi:hypothetical protein